MLQTNSFGNTTCQTRAFKYKYTQKDKKLSVTFLPNKVSSETVINKITKGKLDSKTRSHYLELYKDVLEDIMEQEHYPGESESSGFNEEEHKEDLDFFNSKRKSKIPNQF